MSKEMRTPDGPIITRFAPSPTGYLHLGHAYAALFADRAAQIEGGRCLLRIEDIDKARCRDEYEAAIIDDLAWLGLTWEPPFRHQSAHLAEYAGALGTLSGMGLTYPCFCTRKEIRAEIKAAAHAPHGAPKGPGGAIYPGTCRKLSESEQSERIANGQPYALRLNADPAAAAATEINGGPLIWHDLEAGSLACDAAIYGDPVLSRKDTPASYHLAVVVDDHAQGITLVTRGKDLFEATHIHRLLQALLGFETPRYHHHDLIRDETGKRYAKRDAAHSLRALKEAGTTANEIRAMVGF